MVSHSLHEVAQSKGINEKVWSQAIIKLKNTITLLNSKAKQESNQSHPQLAENIELDNTPIFSCEDLLLYKGVLNFYLKKYTAALSVRLSSHHRTTTRRTR